MQHVDLRLQRGEFASARIRFCHSLNGACSRPDLSFLSGQESPTNLEPFGVYYRVSSRPVVKCCKDGLVHGIRRAGGKLAEVERRGKAAADRPRLLGSVLPIC